MKFVYILILGVSSCEYSGTKQYSEIIGDWVGYEIKFLNNISFTRYNNASIRVYKPNIAEYAILTYIDSIGCFSCKLQLPEWEKFMDELSFIDSGNIPLLFIFSLNDEEETTITKDSADVTSIGFGVGR